jgi:hypothetical protein
VDFARVLESVCGFLDQRGVRYAVIGGLGLAAYGMARTTLDVDLVVDGEAQEELVAFLSRLGYTTLHRSEGYSNHEHADPDWGGVDIVYVRGETSERLFEGARTVLGPRGRELPVPRPEHLAAMKVLAMKNDPTRTFQELADIRFLLELPGVDRGEVRGYFESHGLAERYRELEATL